MNKFHCFFILSSILAGCKIASITVNNDGYNKADLIKEHLADLKLPGYTYSIDNIIITPLLFAVEDSPSYKMDSIKYGIYALSRYSSHSAPIYCVFIDKNRIRVSRNYRNRSIHLLILKSFLKEMRKDGLYLSKNTENIKMKILGHVTNNRKIKKHSLKF